MAESPSDRESKSPAVIASELRSPDASAYRTAAERDPAERPSPELRVTLSRTGAPSGAGLLLTLFALPLGASALLSMVFTPWAGLAGLVGGAGLSAWRWRRRRRDDAFVLSVGSGQLTARSGEHVVAQMSLGELENVSLDTKTVRPVQDGGSAIPAVRFIDSQVGPDVDVARIVLVGSRASVLLNETHVAHMTATEWLGKIRVFLRKHGWVPLDEKGAEDDA